MTNNTHPEDLSSFVLPENLQALHNAASKGGEGMQANMLAEMTQSIAEINKPEIVQEFGKYIPFKVIEKALAITTKAGATLKHNKLHYIEDNVTAVLEQAEGLGTVISYTEKDQEGEYTRLTITQQDTKIRMYFQTASESAKLLTLLPKEFENYDHPDVIFMDMIYDADSKRLEHKTQLSRFVQESIIVEARETPRYRESSYKQNTPEQDKPHADIHDKDKQRILTYLEQHPYLGDVMDTTMLEWLSDPQAILTASPNISAEGSMEIKELKSKSAHTTLKVATTDTSVRITTKGIGLPACLDLDELQLFPNAKTKPATEGEIYLRENEPLQWQYKTTFSSGGYLVIVNAANHSTGPY